MRNLKAKDPQSESYVWANGRVLMVALSSVVSTSGKPQWDTEQMAVLLSALEETFKRNQWRPMAGVLHTVSGHVRKLYQVSLSVSLLVGRPILISRNGAPKVNCT